MAATSFMSSSPAEENADAGGGADNDEVVDSVLICDDNGVCCTGGRLYMDEVGIALVDGGGGIDGFGADERAFNTDAADGGCDGGGGTDLTAVGNACLGVDKGVDCRGWNFVGV